MWIDARIPVRFGPLHSRQVGEAVLTDGDAAGPDPWACIAGHRDAHVAGCACCIPRNQAAVALGQLFRVRATSAGPPFRAVLAVVEPLNEAAVRLALENDPIAAARFRLAAS